VPPGAGLVRAHKLFISCAAACGWKLGRLAQRKRQLRLFFFSGQNNRTLSVEVTALDESRAVTESKVQPVIGMWGLADPGTFPAPANTPLAFNTLTFGMTRLDAILQAATTFRLGIFDYRGDDRPDYRYRARLFYADNVSPARASVAGGTPLTVQGVGFRANTVAVAGTLNAAVLAASANQVILSAPAMADGVQNLALADPATRSSSPWRMSSFTELVQPTRSSWSQDQTRQLQSAAKR